MPRPSGPGVRAMMTPVRPATMYCRQRAAKRSAAVGPRERWAAAGASSGGALTTADALTCLFQEPFCVTDHALLGGHAWLVFEHRAGAANVGARGLRVTGLR